MLVPLRGHFLHHCVMPIFKVHKRDGEIVDFDLQRIETAIAKAFKAEGHLEEESSPKLAQEVYQKLEKKYKDSIPAVEQIQDIVEDTLIRFEFQDVAKVYIRYREKRRQAREHKNVVIGVEKAATEYLDKLDWRVNANSNQGYSLGGFILNTSGKVIANYWLSSVYPEAVGNAHRNADYHIHDLDMFSGYCAGWSLRELLETGFNGIPDKVESKPPKHLSSAVAQMVNFLGTLQNEWAGAQAFSSFDTYLAPYVKKFELELRKELNDAGVSFESKEAEKAYFDEKVYACVYQNIQSLVFNLNVPSRWGTQTPFTNITLDWNCPDDLKDQRLLLGGERFSFTFGELQHEMSLINQAFIKVMTKGDAKGRTFTFPIPTYNITNDFDWKDPDNLPLFEMTAKYGTPYFQNFINSDLRPGDVRSMCCRLQLDLNELKKRGGGLFGSAEMTGSIGVVTINAARIGYVCRGNRQEFIKRVASLMDLARDSLEIKRKEIQKWLDRGLFPYTKRYLGHLRNHFSTIGINGLNEAVRNFYEDKEDMTTKKGQQFTAEILEYMRERLMTYQEESGNLYNLEATPAEGTTYRFAREDQKRFPDIIQAGTEEAPYYTNSSQLPVGHTDDVFEALKLQENLQRKYTGGTVFHCYMSERISGAEACRDLVRKILSNFRIPYITITPTFSICPSHGYLAGEYDFCPKCDVELDIQEASKLDEEYRKMYRNKQSAVVEETAPVHDVHDSVLS